MLNVFSNSLLKIDPTQNRYFLRSYISRPSGRLVFADKLQDFSRQKKIEIFPIPFFVEYQPRFPTILLVQKQVGGRDMFYNKVEIAGVNTSNLKVLKETEKTELLKRIKDGDMDARDELIRGNLRLVLSVIQRFMGRGERADDLFQVGCIGLIKAIDNFDISQNVRFSTYAVPMIMGELRRYLRDNAPVRVSRSMRDLAYRAMQSRERLTAENGCEPKVEDIAKDLDVPRREVVVALEAISDPISLYEPVFSESGDTIFVLDQLGDHNDDMNWLNEISLKEAIAGLGKREKRILDLRFFRGKTQVEVAKEIGISQAQVSRLEKGALNKIKNHI